MTKNKRYTLTIDLYIDARTEREAMVKSALFTERLRNKYDNRAQTIRLEETPFASFERKEIFSGRLDMFENKLIETPSKKNTINH